MFELTQNPESNAVIKVVGVGGGGGNALEHMVAENIDGVEFICANTDAQALGKSNAKIHLRLGDELTKGLGAGADPRIGRQAAEEDHTDYQANLSNYQIDVNHSSTSNRFHQVLLAD